LAIIASKLFPSFLKRATPSGVKMSASVRGPFFLKMSSRSEAFEDTIVSFGEEPPGADFADFFAKISSHRLENFSEYPQLFERMEVEIAREGKHVYNM
jgi:hypothetical protein